MPKLQLRHVAPAFSGVVSAVLVFCLGWGLLNVVELFAASPGPSWLPPPGSLWLSGPLAIAAVAVGLKEFRAEPDWRDPLAWRPGMTIALTVVVVGALSYVAYQDFRGQDYLSYVSANTVDSQTALAAGDEACDWLADQRWGQLDEGTRTLSSGEFARALDQSGRHDRPRLINSTQAHYANYLDHLYAESSGALAGESRVQAQVALVAWYRLCPYQQWVHRPVGGRGGLVGDAD